MQQSPEPGRPPWEGLRAAGYPSAPAEGLFSGFFEGGSADLKNGAEKAAGAFSLRALLFPGLSPAGPRAGTPWPKFRLFKSPKKRAASF
jgi:hypothetical protein